MNSIARVLWVGILLVGSAAHAQIPQRSVLLVYSGERTVSGHSAVRNVSGVSVIDVTLERIVRQDLDGNLYHYSEFVDATRMADPAYADALYDLIRSKYGGSRLDLIFVMGDVAYSFVARYRPSFFPETPIVFSTSDPVRVVSNSTGIRTPVNIKDTLDMALSLDPDIAHVAVVAGASPYDRYYETAARDQFKPFESRVTFTYLTGLAMRDLLQRVATLPPRSIVLFLTLTADGDGRLFLPHETLDALSAVANAPIFSWNALGLNHGVVGGHMQGPEMLATRMAAVGLRVLNGEPAERIPVAEVDWSTVAFDWRQLRRWNIAEDRIPSGSTILFKEPGPWELYRSYIIAGLLLVIVQSALIAGLVVQRARRRGVERDLRGAYERNQDLAGRLISAQEEERGRIARDLHDDLGQQLAVLSILMDGLEHEVGKPGSQEDVERTFSALHEQTDSLAHSIRNLSHELHPSVLEHGGLVPALKRHSAEVGLNHDIAVSFGTDSDVHALSPEAALCLFRVGQEALANAVRHARAHTIRVQLIAAGDAVELIVADDGVGFAAGERAGSGLGLRSIDERVRLEGGCVDIESRVGHGTTVRARVPLAAGRDARARSGT